MSHNPALRGNNNANETNQKGFLRKIFNRRNAGRALAIGLLVDQFGYAGANGGALLRANDVTRPAAPYYETFGVVMHFGWNSFKDLARGINNIVQGHNL